MVRESPDLIRREIAAVRARTDRHFGRHPDSFGTDPALLDEELPPALNPRRIPSASSGMSGPTSFSVRALPGARCCTRSAG